jgi:glucokinase
LILAGDVGGTKTTLALFEEGSERLEPIRETTLPSRDFPSLESVVAQMQGAGPSLPLSIACFGVPGPVVDGRSITPNLPWELDEAKLARSLGIPRVKLLNDLESAGHGVLGLSASSLVPLQGGQPRAGHRALIAAGTGLGEAHLVWDGHRHTVAASEGGHTDFAPRSEREIGLLRYLMRQFGHVSYERVVSGPGLHHVYRFLRETDAGPVPDWLDAKLRTDDPSAVISAAALEGRDPACVEALDLFVSVYGAEAGNLALKGLAVGGVYVGGGIAPKIRAKLEDGRFVLEGRAPLLGAARVAMALAGGKTG